MNVALLLILLLALCGGIAAVVYFAISTPTTDTTTTIPTIPTTTTTTTTTTTIPTTTTKFKPDMKILNLAWSNSSNHAKTKSGTEDVVLLDCDVDSSVVATHVKAGKLVIGYLSVGTYEPYRSDKDEWPKSTIGPMNTEWKENWLALDHWQEIKPVMTNRLKMVKSKGFHAFEADNISVIDQFEDEATQKKNIATNVQYANWLADTAHSVGLLAVFKNGPLLSKDVVQKYDALITEQALKYTDDIKSYNIFKDNSKPIFDFEYDPIDAKVTPGMRQTFSDIQLDTAQGWQKVK